MVCRGWAWHPPRPCIVLATWPLWLQRFVQPPKPDMGDSRSTSLCWFLGRGCRQKVRPCDPNIIVDVGDRLCVPFASTHAPASRRPPFVRTESNINWQPLVEDAVAYELHIDGDRLLIQYPGPQIDSTHLKEHCCVC